MNRKERRAFERAKHSNPNTVGVSIGAAEVILPYVRYKTSTPKDVPPPLFSDRISAKISQLWPVQGAIKVSYSYDSHIERWLYLFEFLSDMLTAGAHDEKMTLLKAADDNVFQQLRFSNVTEAASVSQNIKSSERVPFVAQSVKSSEDVMTENNRSTWVSIVARPRPANNLERYHIESGALECVKKSGVKEIGFNRSGTQIVIAALLEKGLSKEDLDKLKEKIQGRFTSAQFFIGVGFDCGQRAVELADKIALGLKSFPTSTLDQKFTDVMSKIWLKPLIVRDEDKQAQQKLCA